MPRRGENIRKRKDGRWEARFPKGKNEKGKTIYGAVYGSTYKEAKEKRRQRLENPPVDQVNGTDNSFGNLLALWISDNKVRLKASTLYRYQYLIDTHILPEFGIRSMDSITSTVINSFLSDKLEHGRLDGSGGLSAAYVRSITGHMGTMPARMCICLMTAPYSPARSRRSPWGLGSKCRTGMPGMCSPAAAWPPKGWSVSCHL